MPSNCSIYLIISFFFLNLGFSITSSAQLHTKLQWMPDDNHWGIFVKADSSIQPTRDILLGSGQLTVVVPTGFEIGEMKSHMGSWIENARANAPVENPEKDYVSFGIQLSEAITQLGTNPEVLVLTFNEANGDCPSSLYLIEGDDPFVATSPNSLNTNPGNDLQMIDLGNARSIYGYEGNYALDNWNCNVDENVITSLNDLKKKSVIKVFPNPFYEALTFELLHINKGTNLELRIQDNLGKIIHRQLFTDSQLKINMEVSPALYFYQIVDLDAGALLDTGKLLKL